MIDLRTITARRAALPRAAAIVVTTLLTFAIATPGASAKTRKHHTPAAARGDVDRGTTANLNSRGVVGSREAATPIVVGRLGVVTGDNVPINAGREQYGRLLSRVPKGTNLTVTGQTDNYFAVMMVDRSIGFVGKDKVQLLDYEITATHPLDAGGSGPKGQALVQSAMQYMGVPYLWGGNTSDGIDCSGFVKAVYAANGMSLPRTAEQQASSGYEVPLRDVSKWQVGDRMYFQCHHGYIDHTGMYIGNGYFIHSHAGGGVSATRVDDPYYWGHLVATRRSNEMLGDAQPGQVAAAGADTESTQSQ